MELWGGATNLMEDLVATCGKWLLFRLMLGVI